MVVEPWPSWLKEAVTALHSVPPAPLNMRVGFRQGELVVPGYPVVIIPRFQHNHHTGATEWLMERNVDYQWCHNPNKHFFFREEDRKIAMEFKLVWD